MKRSLFPHRLSKLRSFTLVELLVVMAIIAILASVLFTAAGAAIRAAHRTQASAIASQIQTAVSAYYTEYSVYPINPNNPAPVGQDVSYSSNDAGDWEPLMYALCGNINPANPSATIPVNTLNTRGVVFLNPKKSDLDSNTGIFVNPISSTTTVSQNYFNIAMDANYDGLLGNTTSGVTLIDFSQSSMPASQGIMAGVAVWANCNTGGTTNNGFWVRTY